jgi:hypothetical protein
MAFSIIFKKIPRRLTGHQQQYKVLAELRPGRFPIHEHYTAAQMMQIRPGVRGWFPVGLDTRTPGWAKEWNPTRNSNPSP